MPRTRTTVSFFIISMTTVSVSILKKYPGITTGQQECELNNSTHMEHDEDLTADNAYLYRGAKVRKSTLF